MAKWCLLKALFTIEDEERKKNSWTLYNKFSRENSAKIFFSESIIDFTDFIWFILLGLFVGIIAIYDRK